MLEKKGLDMKLIEKLFDSADRDRSGCIDVQEFLVFYGIVYGKHSSII